MPIFIWNLNYNFNYTNNLTIQLLRFLLSSRCLSLFHQGHNVSCIQRPISSKFRPSAIPFERPFNHSLSSRYIEGLQNDTRFITPWEKTLKTNQETAPTVDVTKLPSNWLRKSVQNKPEDVVTALWQLRNFMMRDILRNNY